MNSLLTVNDLEISEIKALIKRALHFKESKDYPQYNHTVVNIFYENSTRTKYSFKMAEKKLGLDVTDFDTQTSSINKGESLYDTLLTFQAMDVEIAVVRHPDNDFYKDLKGLKMGVINAGAGSGEHPTQSLLDIPCLGVDGEEQGAERARVAGPGDLDAADGFVR